MVRRRSAKSLCPGSNPGDASEEKSESFSLFALCRIAFKEFSTALHIQKRIGIPGLVAVRPLVCCKPHVPVKSDCRWVLRVYGNFPDSIIADAVFEKPPAKPHAALRGREEQHFQPFVSAPIKATGRAAFSATTRCPTSFNAGGT